MQRKATNPSWKTDFRQIGSLPDTKAVRTSFYINIISGLLLAASLAFVWTNEAIVSEKTEDLARMQTEIGRLTPSNTELLNLDKEYLALKTKVTDLDNFLSNQALDPLNFISTVATLLPPLVILENIEQRPAHGKITGYIQASAEVATGVVYEIEQTLSKNPILSKNYASISVTNVVKDSQNEKLNFEITFSAAKPTAKKN